MSRPALECCLDQQRQLAALVQRMDDELGLLHGLSWHDFVLLDALEAAGGALPAAALAQKLCVPRSRLLQQLLPLEKIGLVTREAKLLPGGRQRLSETRATALRICAALAASPSARP